ncbi:hypothetical protein ACE14D_27630, partial [Streptomyces sp. Act-28]
MTASRSSIRVLRAALFAAVCVVLSATGHALQSAHPVPVRSLLVAFGSAWAFAWAAASRRRGAASTGCGLAVVQAGMHLMFSTAQGRHGHAAHPGHFGHHGEAAALLPPSGMLMAHLAAAALCGVWLARGERAFLRLARTAFAPLRPPPAAGGGPPP